MSRPALICRYVYIDWLHYSWGALMINAFEGKNVQISGYEVRLHLPQLASGLTVCLGSLFESPYPPHFLRSLLLGCQTYILR